MSDVYEGRSCWMCMKTEDDEVRIDWVQPCRCRGFNQWVHERCLVAYINDNNLLNSDSEVRCSICDSTYIVVEPPMGRMEAQMERIDRMYEVYYPIVLEGAILTLTYLAPLYHGMLAMRLLVGRETFMELLRSHRYTLIVTVPLVPVASMYFRIYDWEGYIIRSLRRRHPQQLNWAVAADTDYSRRPPIAIDFDELWNIDDDDDEAIFGRGASSILMALGLPVFGLILGHCVYRNVQNRIVKFALGTVTFEACRALLSISLRQSRFHRVCGRSVANRNPEDKQK